MPTPGASAVLDTPQVLYPPEVREFCTRNGILQEFDTACDMIRRHFPEARSIEVRVSRDLEVGDEWVSVRVQFVGDAPGFRTRYRAYVSEFVDRIPVEVRSMVRLGCGIVKA